jgi:hypothetical protein
MNKIEKFQKWLLANGMIDKKDYTNNVDPKQEFSAYAESKESGYSVEEEPGDFRE